MLHASTVNSKKRLWIWTGLVLVAGVGLAVSASAAPPPKSVLAPGTRLLLIGDSLAVGLATPLGQIAQESGVTLKTDARSGTRIDQWANQPWLASVVASFRPTVILVSLGTNDMKLADPATTQKPFLIRLAALLRGTGARVVWIAPPTMPFPDKGVQALIRTSGFPVFGSEALTIPRTSDGIHPTAAGYAGFAGSVWRWTDKPAAALGAAPGKPRRRWFEGRFVGKNRLDARRRFVKR